MLRTANSYGLLHCNLQSVEEHQDNLQKYANGDPIPYAATRRVVVHEGS